jgi:hypothetical protein
MTKEEKLNRKKERAKYHRKKRMDKYIAKIILCENLPLDVPLGSVSKYGSWSDSNSPTGYSQICCYQGICQSPCNGDC